MWRSCCYVSVESITASATGKRHRAGPRHDDRSQRRGMFQEQGLHIRCGACVPQLAPANLCCTSGTVQGPPELIIPTQYARCVSVRKMKRSPMDRIRHVCWKISPARRHRAIATCGMRHYAPDMRRRGTAQHNPEQTISSVTRRSETVMMPPRTVLRANSVGGRARG